MDSKTEELLERTFQFGVDVLTFLFTLPKSKVNDVLTYQLAKAATSVGANYEESQAAESKNDFVHKISIVLKEARESNYWLRVFKAILKEEVYQNPLDRLINESQELKSIFSRIKITASGK